MITPHGLFAAKVAVKTAVVVAVVQLAAYEITPEAFSSASVGIGALVVAAVAVATMIFHARSETKMRQQLLTIAREQGAAMKEQGDNIAKTYGATHEIKLSVDGRMDQIVAQTKIISEALGVEKERTRAAVEKNATDVADAGALRDDKIVHEVSDAVVQRIGEAADAAAQAVPGTKSPPGT